MLDKVWMWLSAIGGVLLLVMWLHYYSVVSNLEDKLETAQSDLKTCTEKYVLEQANLATLKGALNDANDKVRDLGLKHDKAIEEYEAYKKLPPKIKYETLYKYIKENKSNECEDVKIAIDGVSRYINDSVR